MNDTEILQQPIPRAAAGHKKWLLWLIGFIVLVGLALRIKAGFPAPGLWADELIWITRIKKGFQAGIRAQGYIHLHALYFKWFGVALEYQIRLFSILSGLAFVPLFALLVHRLFARPWLTILGTILAAINIAAISFTHEFKPYAIDLLFHTAWLYSLIAIRTQGRALLVSSVVLLIGVFLSYSMVPIVAFQLTYLGYLLIRQRLSPVEAIAPSFLLFGYSVYFALLYPTLHGTDSGLWGTKYGVFFSPELHGNGVAAYLSWALGKVSAYVTLPLNWYFELPLTARTRGFTDGHGFVEAPVLGLMCLVLMAVKLCRSKLDDPRLIPLLLLGGYTLAGILKMFPLGYFRSNLFLLCYATLTLLFLIEPLEKLPKRWFVSLVVALTLPTLLFTMRGPFAEKYFHRLPLKTILESLCDRPGDEPVRLIVDGKLRGSVSFYMSRNLDPQCSKRLQVTKLMNRGELPNQIATAKEAHVFFAGSTAFPPAEIVDILARYPNAHLVAEGGGSYHYFVSDASSSMATPIPNEHTR